MPDEGPAPPSEGRPPRDLPPDQQFWQLCRQGRRPDLPAFLAARPGLGPADVASVVALDQYERWMAGDRAPAEGYLALLPPDGEAAQAAQAACDVVYGEYLVREQLGEQPQLEEYCRRFPDLAAALTRQVELHQALGAGVEPAGTVHAPGPPPPPPPAALEGAAVPGYELQGELGRGGMGVVYRARQLSLDREVALKVVPARGGEAALARARREAQALARLSHPNIVTVYDAGTAGGALYLAMELVEGTDLHRMVDKTGPLDVDLARDLLLQAARGLGHAHERGLVHRDVKPSNLLVSAGAGPPVLKVLDLGLARLAGGGDAPAAGPPATLVGAFLGTPEFIAPEQANDPRAADARSDLYSLGCTFYFALTGRPPFTAPTPLGKLMHHHLTAPAPLREHRADVPPDLAAVIERLLAKRPEDRYPSAADLAAALEVGTAPAPAAPPPPPAPAPRPAAPALTPGPRLAGHADWVKGVAFTADGRLAVSASLDRTVRAWEVATGREAWRGEAHAAGVLCVAASPAGLATGGEDRAVLLWRPGQPAPAWRGEGHAHNVNAVAFTPDGARVVSASHDGTLRLWAAESGQALRAWAAHAGAVWMVAVAPGGRLALSAGQDRAVRLWDVTTGEAVGALPELAAPVSCVAVSPDGRTALVGGADGLVRLWDLKSLAEVRVLDGHAGRVTALAVSPDGRLAASASRDQSLRVWSLETGQGHALTGHSHWVTSVAWSPDGAWLASGSGDRTVGLWRAGK